MMQKIGRIFGFLFFVGVGMGILTSSVKKEEPKQEKYTNYVNELMGQFAREMKKDYGLFVCGTGGSMPFGVASINMMFKYHQRATLEEAREIEVIVTEKFIERINQDKRLRKYLREYPFPASQAEITISFCKVDNSEYDDGSVAYVTHSVNRFKQDKIRYYQKDAKIDDYKDLYEELYPEAFAIVQKKFQSMNPPKVLRHIPEKDDNYEIYVNQLFYEFMQRDIGFTQEKLVLFDQGVKMRNNIEELTIEFNDYQKADIQEARRIALLVADKFIKKINEKENLQKYLCERPFPVDRTKVVISFCHDDNTRITEGISEVRYEKGEISYYLENKKGKLQEIFREPYKK